MKKPNPMAKDLRQPKYKPQVIPDKKETYDPQGETQRRQG